MAKFTILELHLDDASFSASAPFSGGKEVEAADQPPEEEESSGKGKLVAALIGLVFLVAVAYVVRTKVLGGDGEGKLAIDEIEA